MPRVRGFLQIVDGPGGEGPVDPGFGNPGGGWSPVDPGFGNPPPRPPGGAWPPPTIELPIAPAPPDTPPGAIWPPPDGPPAWGDKPPDLGGGKPPDAGDKPPDKLWVLVWISGGYGWHYVCVDPSALPAPK